MIRDSNGDLPGRQPAATQHQQRQALLVSGAALGLAVVALGLIPFDLYWQVLLGPFALHRLWPLLVAIPLALIFCIAGRRAHRASGLPQFFPILALALALAFLGLVTLLLTETAADWSVEWSLAALIVLALAGLLITLFLFSHGELWRFVANAAIVRYVSNSLIDGGFWEQAQAEVANTGWPSPHCLEIARGHYRQQLAQLLAGARIGFDPARLIAYLQAGDDLSRYLGLPWPPELLAPAEQDRQIKEVIREMVTCYLITDPTRRPGQFAARVEHWCAAFREARDPYGRLLSLIISLGRAATPADPVVVLRQTILLFDELLQTTLLFDRLPAGAEQHHQQRLWDRCLHSWLALAHHSLPGQACFDLWLELQSRHDENLFASFEQRDGTDYDPAKLGAIWFLAGWYKAWRDQTPQGWEHGLHGRWYYVDAFVALATQ